MPLGPATPTRQMVQQPHALLPLDPVSAWRADTPEAGVEARRSGEPTDCAQNLLVLEITSALNRLRRLPATSRALYARASTDLWIRAAQVYQNTRYTQVALVMRDWGDEAPALPQFRELLWSVEQIESAGLLNSAHVGLTCLRAMVPEGDVRSGYAWAQSGRVYRTLGLLQQSQVAFELAIDTATAHNDMWLKARSQLGLGALLHGRGAYPTAKALFRKALQCAVVYPDLQIGAHLGLVSVAKAIEEYDDALSHGWEALHLAQGEAEVEAEALAVLASLSLDVGEYVATRNTCVRALALSPRLPIRQPLVRTLVQAALALGDVHLIDHFFPELESIARSSANPWEQAHALRVSAEVHSKRKRRDSAISLLQRSREISKMHGFAELEWLAEEAITRLDSVPDVAPPACLHALKTYRLNHSSSAVLMELSRHRV